MTAREEAISIYKEHMEWISKSYYHDGTYSKSDEEKAKECSLITVNEKIKTCNKFYNRLSFPAEVKSDGGYIHFKKELEYLNNVIEEIDKL